MSKEKVQRILRSWRIMVSALAAAAMLTTALRAEDVSVLSQLGLETSLFAGSNCLLDKCGRQLVKQAEESGSVPEDLAAVESIANLKQFTLVHCDLVIQQYFSADALAGLDRTLIYAGRTAPGDELVGQYNALSRKHAEVTDEMVDVSQRYQAVFPFVVKPPINRPAHDMAYFQNRYKGSRDFAAVTGAMLDQVSASLDRSKLVETSARQHLKALGARGGADWAPGCDLRTKTSPRRQPGVVNFDDNGKPNNIIVGNTYGGAPTGPQHIALLEKFTFDYICQQYTSNRLDANGDITNQARRYGRHSLPGEIQQPCSNHSASMYCERPLYDRFKHEGRLAKLFAGPGYGRGNYTASYSEASSLAPVDWTLPEVQAFQANYLRKVAAVYANRPDISYVKISWEPTNAWGSEADPARPDQGEYFIEGGHTSAGIASFRKRMADKFGSIESLNRAWRSDYLSLMDIDVSAFRRAWPTDRTGATPLFYEWQMHRRAMMAEWWEHCADALRAGGLKRPIAIEVPVPSNVQVRHALEPYILARAGDMLQNHQGFTPTNREILLESLEHYYPDKTLGSGEYSWNEPEAWNGAAEPVVGAAGERNLWRGVAHGQTVFGVYGAMDTYCPYPGWHPNSGNNMLEYFTDYSIMRPSAGALQLAHVKLDAIKDVWLNTRPVPRRLAVYWPTASMINALPLDIHTSNGSRYAGGIIPTLHDMLFDRGYAYRYVFEKAVLDGQEDLSKITVLILPYAAWLADPVGERLVEWVREGGTLIAAGPFGAQTPYGFEDGSAMRTIFGEDFVVEHQREVEWIIAGEDCVETAFGKGRVFMTASGFGLFHGAGNRRFWCVLDSAISRTAWCTNAAGTVEPKVDLVLRQDAEGVRYLSVTNENAFGPMDIVLGIKGSYPSVADLGVCGSANVRPQLDGPNSYIRLKLRAGEGTVFKLGRPSASPANLDSRALRTEVVRLARLQKKTTANLNELSRESVARQYNELLHRKSLLYFEPARLGTVIVSAPLTDNLDLAITDGETPHLTAPDTVYGEARIEDGALLLAKPASGVSYIGEGMEGETWGGSLASIAGKPFTIQLEFIAMGEDSAGTLIDIWYGESYPHFRISLLTGGKLQIHQIIRHWGDGTQRVLTTKPLRLTDGRWHHIAVTVPNIEDEARGGIGLYLDGDLICRESDPDTHGQEYVLNHVQPNLPTGNPGLPVINSWVYNWSIGCRQFMTTRHADFYRDPKDLDTLLGRYRNLVVTQGVNPPSRKE